MGRREPQDAGVQSPEARLPQLGNGLSSEAAPSVSILLLRHQQQGSHPPQAPQLGSSLRFLPLPGTPSAVMMPSDNPWKLRNGNKTIKQINLSHRQPPISFKIFKLQGTSASSNLKRTKAKQIGG